MAIWYFVEGRQAGRQSFCLSICLNVFGNILLTKNVILDEKRQFFLKDTIGFLGSIYRDMLYYCLQLTLNMATFRKSINHLHSNLQHNHTQLYQELNKRKISISRSKWKVT